MRRTVSLLFQCWRWPNKFELSRKTEFRLMLANSTVCLLIEGFTLFWMCLSPPKSTIGWVVLCAAVLLGVLAPVVAHGWITLNARPGIGYVYVCELDDYLLRDQARWFFEDELEGLERKYEKAKRVVEDYNKLRQKYLERDKDINRVCEDDLDRERGISSSFGRV